MVEGKLTFPCIHFYTVLKKIHACIIFSIKTLVTPKYLFFYFHSLQSIVMVKLHFIEDLRSF